MSEIKVNSIKGVGASAAAITVNNSDGTCTANITNKPNRNLIINGAMQVAQRGTSSTTSGYGTVDRFQIVYDGTDESPTQAQVDVSSGTTPYTEGFRKALKITNGNQTSGAGTGDYIYIRQKLEAQNLANSGWNYVSSNNFITLSFWVKSSVAQTFYGYLKTDTGTEKNYPFETGSLTADTWTKIVRTIPGNSDISVDNGNGTGLEIVIAPFWGTDFTGSVSLNAWSNWSSATRTPDSTSTFYTTNDATFEITGVQLEVGSVATDFEHRSFAQELALCERYYQNSYLTGNVPASSTSNDNAINLISWSDGNCIGFTFPRMRAAPSVTVRNPSSTTVARVNASGNDRSASAVNINDHHVKYIAITNGVNTSWVEVCYELNSEL